jgi:adenosyl cobinamide kinase/adenosyl cobinamide phosphate guanylyltransferase
MKLLVRFLNSSALDIERQRVGILGVRFQALDLRSRKNIVVSTRAFQECRNSIKIYVENGYGLNIVPELDLLSETSKATWLDILGNIVEEMVRRGHEVLLVGRDFDEDLKAFEEELVKRGL